MSVNPIDWIKNGTDCEKCKWCWEECSHTDCGTEWDSGCYIKGSGYDEKPCRLINPFKFILGWIRKKKDSYYFGHEYDGFGEWYEEDQAKTKAMKKAITNSLDDRVICFKGLDDTLHECNLDLFLNDAAWRVRDKYDSVAHPFENKRLRQEWKELIVKTWNRFTGIFKPYFCK